MNKYQGEFHIIIESSSWDSAEDIFDSILKRIKLEFPGSITDIKIDHTEIVN